MGISRTAWQPWSDGKDSRGKKALAGEERPNPDAILKEKRDKAAKRAALYLLTGCSKPDKPGLAKSAAEFWHIEGEGFHDRVLEMVARYAVRNLAYDPLVDAEVQERYFGMDETVAARLKPEDPPHAAFLPVVADTIGRSNAQ